MTTISTETKPEGAFRNWLEIGEYIVDDQQRRRWKHAPQRYPKRDARLTVRCDSQGRGASRNLYWVITIPDGYPLTLLKKSGDARHSDEIFWQPEQRDLRILLYDVEIIQGIPPKTGERLPGIVYCEGWDDKEHMGISIIAAYTEWNDEYHVFCSDNFEEFYQLTQQATHIIGFNSESFDDVVCHFNGIDVHTDIDLLREVYRAKGWDPYPEEFTEKYKGYSLDALCRANGIPVKTGHGSESPILWQQGKYGTVINYCLHDVNRTKRLFDTMSRGKLVDPCSQQPITITRLFNVK